MAKVGFLLLLVAASAPHVVPLQVFKCLDGGQVAYQSQQCAGPPVKVWTVQRLPQTAGPPAVPRPATRAAPRSRRTAPARRNARPAEDACASARKGRDAAFRKAGLKRGFALSSHWDNRVHEACW